LTKGTTIVEAWNKQKKDEYEYLIICSDETTGDGEAESASSYGIDVTTNTKEIHGFLNRKTDKSLIVFSTYQSSKLLKEAQKDCPDFDLIVFDEAHRCTGYMGRQFTYALDDKNIRGKKRLFMTATERYIKQVVKDKAGEVDFEIASMDDEKLYGPIFHELSFGQAIEKQLLNNYQVAIVVVSEDEAREMVEKGKLVKTKSGVLSDARTMATQMAIAKAMKKYDITKMITFHSSVKKAKDFINEEKDDSLPSTIKMMKTKPAKSMWYGHISGKTAASQRKSLLEEFKSLPKTTKSILTNCSCLKEGVDIPALDGIAFVDPKSSIIDIVQAVGRAIRKTPDNKPGTIIVPVFIDPEKEEEALDSSAFKIVGYVLRALQQHDEALREELEGYRLEVGKRRASGKVRMPTQVKVDIHTVLPKEFEQNLLVKIIKVGAKKPDLTEEQILDWADEYHARTGQWPYNNSGSLYDGLDESWGSINAALHLGLRGLSGGSSLAKLLAQKRDKRNAKQLASFTKAQILGWADAHYARTGVWPKSNSGSLHDVLEEDWKTINAALYKGFRGFPGGSSLAQFLAKERGTRNQKDLPLLTKTKILQWADAHHARTGKWPIVLSGCVYGAPEEKWANLNAILAKGGRNLPGGSSLAKLLTEERDVRNKASLPPLTKTKILQWADAHHARTGKWPNAYSGSVYDAPEEKWKLIHAALYTGLRGLLGGSSLAKLLTEERDVRNKASLPLLTQTKILQWADAHHARTGKWPTQSSGEVYQQDGEIWGNISAALRLGLRGLSKGTSLHKLLKKHIK
jgi:superfamily II DNA or RNA helicase